MLFVVFVWGKLSKKKKRGNQIYKKKKMMWEGDKNKKKKTHREKERERDEKKRRLFIFASIYLFIIIIFFLGPSSSRVRAVPGRRRSCTALCMMFLRCRPPSIVIIFFIWDFLLLLVALVQRIEIVVLERVGGGQLLVDSEVFALHEERDEEGDHSRHGHEKPECSWHRGFDGCRIDSVVNWVVYFFFFFNFSLSNFSHTKNLLVLPLIGLNHNNIMVSLPFIPNLHPVYLLLNIYKFQGVN